MKKAFLFLFFLFPTFCFAQGFSVTQVEVWNGTASGTSVTCTQVINPVVGHLMRANVTYYTVTNTGTSMTAADDAGKTYTVRPDTGYLTGVGQGFAAYLIVPSGATKTVTFTFAVAPSSGFMSCFLEEVSAPGTISFDAAVITASGSGVINSPTCTVAGSNEYIAALAADADTIGTVSGSWVFSAVGNQTGFGVARQLNVSSNTAVGFTGSTAMAFNSICISFKYASTTIRNFGLSGVGK